MSDAPSKDRKKRRNTRTPTAERLLVGTTARFVVLSGAQLGRTYSFQLEAHIGRGSDADIVLDDTEVSRRHVRVWLTDDGKYMLEDLASRNGTLINGVPVTRETLKLGDKIQLGSRVLLLFSARDPIEDQVLQRQRLEALGRLGTGVAHDFNNMLGVVLTNLDFMRTRPAIKQSDDEIIERSLQDMEAATARAAQLAARLLSFARSAGQAHGPVNLSAICTEIAELAGRTFGRGIDVKLDTEPALVATGNDAELHQVLMNLCLNARDAMPRGGTLVIQGRRLSRDEQYEGPCIELSVKDSGIGMPPQVVERIFEPFFTTKREGAGFGLGLATVGELVSAHGGRIEVDSKVGGGSSFRVIVPAALSPSRHSRSTATEPPPRPSVLPRATSDAVILLVDDEEIVRNSVERILTDAGYQVVLATDGEDGLRLFQQQPQRPDLVILNMDMPKLDGVQTLRRLRSIDATARVMFASGYFAPDAEDELRARGVLGLLRKPFGAAELLGEVATALTRTVRTDEEATLDITLP
jgi:signal transduction histidine kinase/ActR/RegA family two-component response regulator